MVSFVEFNSRGAHNWILSDARAAWSAIGMLSRGGSHPLMLSQVTASGQFIGDATETLQRIMDAVRDSGRVFRQGNVVVFLADASQQRSTNLPTTIAIDGEITKTATAMIRNLIMCRERKGNPTGKGARLDQPVEVEFQFAVPHGVLQQAVSFDGFFAALPEARYVVNHPVFDADFQWLGVGYHAAQRILVRGEEFEPAEPQQLGPWAGPPRSIQDVLGRLPPRLRQCVEGFHWGSPTDLINYIGAALMVPLMPMLVDDGHPGIMFWGNQPGVGKSVAAQLLAILKDNALASPTAIDGGAREVENQIASELNDGRTVVFIDNHKGKLDVPVIEANMTAKEVAIRGFKVQRKIRRPNDLLWLFTTNGGDPSDDMLSRCVHIGLRYEGDPDSHQYHMSESELLGYAREHRSEILAELAGMIVGWLDAGRPSAPANCRFRQFGHVVGGVLAFNGLPGFLANSREAVREHSTKHQQLIALAERLIDEPKQGFVWRTEGPLSDADDAFKRQGPPANPMEQKDWVPHLSAAGVIPSSADTPQKQKAAATQYLSGVVKLPVEVEINDQPFQAMIVSRTLRSRRTAYALAICERPATTSDSEGGGGGDGDGAGVATQLATPATASTVAVADGAPPLAEGSVGGGVERGDDEGNLWD